METLINIANLMYILSYFVQDLLRIRLLTVIGAAILVLYFYLQPEPVMIIIYWNIFFILLNMFQVFRIIRERQTGDDLLALLVLAASSWLSKLTAIRQSNAQSRNCYESDCF